MLSKSRFRTLGKKALDHFWERLFEFPGGFEPPTRRLVDGCSIQLSYGTSLKFRGRFLLF